MAFAAAPNGCCGPLIVGFAGPVLNPSDSRGGAGDLVIALDGSWAGAPSWTAQMDRVDGLLTEAAAADRRVAIVNLADLPVGDLPFAAPGDWRNKLANLQPQPWQPSAGSITWIENQADNFETFWMSDGIDWDGRNDLLAAFEAHGPCHRFPIAAPDLWLASRTLR